MGLFRGHALQFNGENDESGAGVCKRPLHCVTVPSPKTKCAWGMSWTDNSTGMVRKMHTSPCPKENTNI